MSNVILSVVFVVISTICFSTEAKVSTKLTVVPPGVPILKLNGEKRTLDVKITNDDGVSNWGDLIYRSRQSEDQLLLRDLVIYPAVSTNNQTLRYTASFDDYTTVTSVRLINVGRQRAFGSEIDVYSSDVDVIYVLPAETDPRVFIEVYGYTN